MLHGVLVESLAPLSELLWSTEYVRRINVYILYFILTIPMEWAFTALLVWESLLRYGSPDSRACQTQRRRSQVILNPRSLTRFHIARPTSLALTTKANLPLTLLSNTLCAGLRCVWHVAPYWIWNAYYTITPIMIPSSKWYLCHHQFLTTSCSPIGVCVLYLAWALVW